MLGGALNCMHALYSSSATYAPALISLQLHKRPLDASSSGIGSELKKKAKCLLEAMLRGNTVRSGAKNSPSFVRKNRISFIVPFVPILDIFYTINEET